MSQNVAKLKPRDEALAAQLALGQTLTAAAAAVGLNRNTAARKLADLTFRGRVSELQEVIFAEAQGVLTGGLAEAVAAVVALLKHSDPLVKLQAARTLLAHGLTYRREVELERRLRGVEANLFPVPAQPAGVRPPAPRPLHGGPNGPGANGTPPWGGG
jgi:hypothetical protein